MQSRRSLLTRCCPAARCFSTAAAGMMRAAVLRNAAPSNWSMRVEKLRIPVPGPSEVLLRNRACGLCRTDLSVMKADIKFPLPAVMGHETSGEIVELGKDANLFTDLELRVGQQAMVPFILPCGFCSECRRGNEEICESFIKHNRGAGALYDGKSRLFGEHGERISQYSQGGLAEYSVVPATSVFPLPDSIPVDEAAIIGCSVFTAYGAVFNAAQLKAGESILVTGAGGIGQAVVQWAHAIGAAPIIAVDINDIQLERLLEMGATHIINSSKVDALKAVLQITKNRGVDVAIECLGKPATVGQNFNSVAGCGRAVSVGLAALGVMAPIEINRLVRRQITLKGSYGARARRDCPQILDFIHRGKFKLNQGITNRVSLEHANDAYVALNEGKSHGRVIIDYQMDAKQQSSS